MVASCGGNNAASNLVKTPEYPTDKQTKCTVAKSQAEPLIVEWPNSARAKLESLTSRGLVAVRYAGCELEVLQHCRVREEKRYTFVPVTPKHNALRITNADELYTNLPTGALKLEAKLQTAGELNVEMDIVGRYEAPQGKMKRSAFDGECDKATHVITGLTVGAFTFSAGGNAKVGGKVGVGDVGGGGSSSASREILTRDGDEAECKKGPITDKPPLGCGALIQIEVATLSEEERRCGDGEVLVGGECVAKAVPPPTMCQEDEKFEDGRCVYKPRTVYKPRPRIVSPPPEEKREPPKPKEEEEKPGQKGTLHAVLGTTALVGLTTFSVAGLVALNKSESAFKDGNCNEDTRVCNAAGFGARNEAVTWGWIANVGLGVGLLAGVLFYVIPAPKTQVGFSPSGVWMRGHF
jgi:hypothetical protein